MKAQAILRSVALLSFVACHASTEPRAPYSTAVRADGPLAYWRFEETAGPMANDSSGHERGGEYIPGAALGASVGIAGLGNAVLLQTTDDGVVSDSSAWSSVGTVSAEAWIRPDSVTTPEGVIVIDKGEVWNLILDRQGKPAFHAFYLVGGDITVTAAAAVQAGQTYHLVGTFGNGTVKLYVNGQLAGEATAASSLDIRDNAVHVGRGLSSVRWEFYGVIDEVAIYDKVLSADAVRRHYNAGR